MISERIQHGVFFSPVAELPRGRYALDRDEVANHQRERLMAAFTEMVARHGLAAVSVTNLVAHAAVSRAAFYTCFDDLTACADAAYERFIAVLLERLAAAMDPSSEWHVFIESAIRTYLETLQSDPVVARAMQIEMDAAGSAARLRRRNALRGLASLIQSRHELLRKENPSIGPLPYDAHVGTVYAVRQLACDALEDGTDLLTLVEPTVSWVAAAVAGAALIDARPSI